MRPFWGRFLRHAAGVGITLAVIGYLLAQAFLMTRQAQPGAVYNESNDRVLWQTPVVMAVFGILMCGGFDLLAVVFRKPAAVPVKPPSSPDLAV